MLFFRHPRPVVDNRAVPVQIAQHKTVVDMKNNVLVVPAPKPPAQDSLPPAATPDAPAGG